jgi:hypothetical protein
MTKALLLDLSGVLYDGDTIIAGALEAVQRSTSLQGVTLRHRPLRMPDSGFAARKILL